jgi:hypothetical protein
VSVSAVVAEKCARAHHRIAGIDGQCECGIFPLGPTAIRELVQRLDRAEANPKVIALDLTTFDAIDLVDAILYLCDQAALSTEQVTAIRNIIEARP